MFINAMEMRTDITENRKKIGKLIHSSKNFSKLLPTDICLTMEQHKLIKLNLIEGIILFFLHDFIEQRHIDKFLEQLVICKTSNKFSIDLLEIPDNCYIVFFDDDITARVGLNTFIL